MLSLETWLGRAKCKDAETSAFYEDSLRDGRDVTEDELHLSVIDFYCERCPVRRQCLELALESEGSAPPKHRFGIKAGLTPAQRYSINRRRAARCPVCGTTLDPLSFRTGAHECDECGWVGRSQAVPENGDDWQPRHTPLAVRTLDYLLEHHSLRSNATRKLPSPHWLAKEFGVRKADVGRVYDALAYTMAIEKRGTVYHLLATKEELELWCPPHLSLSQAWRTMSEPDNEEQE